MNGARTQKGLSRGKGWIRTRLLTFFMWIYAHAFLYTILYRCVYTCIFRSAAQTREKQQLPSNSWYGKKTAVSSDRTKTHLLCEDYWFQRDLIIIIGRFHTAGTRGVRTVWRAHDRRATGTLDFSQFFSIFLKQLFLILRNELCKRGRGLWRRDGHDDEPHNNIYCGAAINHGEINKRASRSN